MRSSLILSTFLSLALARPAKRDGASVLGAISKIESSIQTLNTAIGSFNGGVVTVLGIQGKDIDLGNAVQDATQTVQASGPLSDQESGQVANAIVNQLAPQIYAVLNTTVGKAHQFDTAVFGISSAYPQVAHDLTLQKQYSDAFGAAIVSKLTPSYAQAAPAVLKQIDAAFDNAISQFQKPGGLPFPVLPDLPRFGGSQQMSNAMQSLGDMQSQAQGGQPQGSASSPTSSQSPASGGAQPQGASQPQSSTPSSASGTQSGPQPQGSFPPQSNTQSPTSGQAPGGTQPQGSSQSPSGAQAPQGGPQTPQGSSQGSESSQGGSTFGYPGYQPSSSQGGDQPSPSGMPYRKRLALGRRT